MASGKRADRRVMSWAIPLAVAAMGAPSVAMAAGQADTPPAPVQASPLPPTPAPVVPAEGSPAAQVAMPGAAAATPLTTPATFLALSDIHYTGKAGRCPQPGGPETDPQLWSAAQAEARQVIKAEKPAFAIYLGDLPSHCMPYHQSELKAALNGLADIVGTGTKLIYVSGNNDPLRGDYDAFSTGGKTALGLSRAWRGGPVLNAAPGDMIDSAHFLLGYYSVYAVRPASGAGGGTLRVIVLNTTMFTKKYAEHVPSQSAQSDAQLEWLNAQLKDVAAKGEKVIIAMHVPPGIDGYGGGTMWKADLNYGGHDPDLMPGWIQQTFLKMVADHAGDVVGLLSSHTHVNEIRRLHGCGTGPGAGGMVALDVAIPSITTDHGNNPSVKLFSYDDRFAWIENRTWYASDASGAGWGTNPVMSFNADNFPCASCSAGATLAGRIGAIDDATLYADMMAWLKVGALPVASGHSYLASMDVTCDAAPVQGGAVAGR